MMVNNPLIFVGVAKAEKAIEWDRNIAIAHKWLVYCFNIKSVPKERSDLIHSLMNCPLPPVGIGTPCIACDIISLKVQRKL